LVAGSGAQHWLTRLARYAGDPSLRLKSGSALDDADIRRRVAAGINPQ